MPIPLSLAYEDTLTGFAIDKLLAATGGRYAIGGRYSRGGVGYLARTLPGFNAAAKGCPFLVIADLDNNPCPRALINSWLNTTQHPNLLVRIAVREVEAWLIADRHNFSQFFGVPLARLPNDADAINDAKRFLVNLARTSRFAKIANAVAPPPGAPRSLGPDYNGTLSRFVAAHWDPHLAASHSDSLRRAIARLQTFVPTW